MKRLLHWILVLAALHVGSLFGQTFTGTWQGVLKVPQGQNGELRIVIKISTTEADKLSAQFYSLDQGAEPYSANAVTASGLNLKITFTAMNASYEGKLNPEGNTVAGTWSQSREVPLNLTRATPETEWTIPEPPPPLKAMDSSARPEFEVSTIKPSDPKHPGWFIHLSRTGMVTTQNTTLADLITFAFDLNPKQVVGAPAWFDSDRFDVSGKPDVPGLPTTRQLQMMLRKLLVDRFSLSFRIETREMTAYVLTISKGGEKIREETTLKIPGPGFFGGQPQRGLKATNATMTEFLGMLKSQFLDLPVVDQTGLGDVRYTFVLKFTPDPAMRPFGAAAAPPESQTGASDPDAPPDLFSAMERQAGLHMQKTRASVVVMVIDKIEKPSPN